MAQDLIELYQKLSQEYREKNTPVLTPQDIHTHAEWEHAEPVRSMSKRQKKGHMIGGLKSEFGIHHAPVLRSQHKPPEKNLLVGLLKHAFNM